MDSRTPRFAGEDEEAAWALSRLREGDRAQKIDARDRLAYIFEGRGLLDAAVECLETNIRDGVRDPRVYQRLAGIYRRQGQSDLAEEALAEARALEQRRREERPAVPRIDDLSDEPYEGEHPLEAPTRPLPAAVPPARPMGDADPFEATLVDQPLARSGIGEPDVAQPGTGRPSVAREPRPWYTAPAVVVLAILLCGPFGIALLWLQTRYPTRTKWTVTGAWLGLNALAAFAGWTILQSNLEPLIGQVQARSTPTAPALGTPVIGAPGALPFGTPGSPAPSPGGVAVSPGLLPFPSPSPVAPGLPGLPSPPAAVGQPSPAAAGSAARVRVADTAGQGASLRESPSSSATRIKVLIEGTVVDAIGPEQQAEGRGWRNVRDSTGATGWIASEFLEPAS